MPLGLYIHVPFCQTRCHFCAFYLQIHREDRARRYLGSLEREVRLHRDSGTLRGRRLDTLYFGGGTPTTLRPECLCRMVELAKGSFGFQDPVEITVEAHPDSVSEGGLEQLARAGVNRISFGVQSLDDRELLRLGRRHLDRTLAEPLAMARKAGILNINLDLIYGLPGQTLESWRATVDEALRLEPTHLSCYALTVEEGTRLQVDLHRGCGHEPDPSLQNAMEEEAAVSLGTAGFAQYEISNFSRPGFVCRHNLLYWEGADYLGLGPSAQSYLDGCRFGNVADLRTYHQALDAGRLPLLETEHLSAEQQRRERIVFGLRLTHGIDMETIRFRHEGGPEDRQWSDTVARLVQEGLLEQDSGRMRLTALGRRYADSIAVALL